MSRIRLYFLSGIVAVGLLFRAAVPALAQQQNTPELAHTAGPLLSIAPPVVVVDSTGAEVGPYENIGGSDTVLQKIAGSNYALQVNTKGFVATGVTFSFTGGTCVGTKYVVSQPSNSFYFSYPKTANPTGVNESLNGGVAGSTLYYATPKTSVSKTIGSELVVGTNGKTQICYPIPGTKSSVSTVSTIDIGKLPFVPPFKLSY
jgi:hypothetical protein